MTIKMLVFMISFLKPGNDIFEIKALRDLSGAKV